MNKADVYERLGGFSGMRYGEDIDFSAADHGVGYLTRLFPSAWVYYHKGGRISRSSSNQSTSFGGGRIALNRKHPGSLKLVHCLPALFTFFSLSIGYRLILLPLVSGASYYLCPLLFVDAMFTINVIYV